ncbi:MAG: alanine racemase [Micavibrio sp.]
MTSPAASIAPAILTVSLKNLVKNYTMFRAMTGAAVAGVIKADAYGTGAKQVHAALYKAGCRHFFVATPDEAIAIRDADKESQIMVLGGLYKGAEDFYAGRGIIPVINSMEEAARWKSMAHKLDTKLPAVLHYDTGMNRLGLGPDDLPDTDAFDLRLVMSHFACADEEGHPMNGRQAQAFARIARAFPNASKSLCNSSGLFRDKAWHYDLVRPGYALYGGNPVPEKENPVLPVASLKARILQTRLAAAGESAGYSATHIFNRPTQIATVAMGYADGILRSGSSRAAFFYRDRPCPVAGRVSMDLITVDLGDGPNPPREGEWLELLGPHQGVDALAKDCGTIGYEILTSLSRRAARVYES